MGRFLFFSSSFLPVPSPETFLQFFFLISLAGNFCKADEITTKLPHEIRSIKSPKINTPSTTLPKNTNKTPKNLQQNTKKSPTITNNHKKSTTKTKNHKLSDQRTQRNRRKKKTNLKKRQKNTPLTSPAWGHDPPDSGAVVDHGSLSELLHFSQSPFPSPCLREEKGKKIK
jgi:hypothetical protein